MDISSEWDTFSGVRSESDACLADAIHAMC